MEQRTEYKAEGQDKPWIPVIVRWLHKYELWKSRLEYLDEKRQQEPKVVARLTGMPGGSMTGNSTLDTAQARLEASEEIEKLYDIQERIHILDLAFKAMKQEEMLLIRTIYFDGVEKDPWDALLMSRTTYFRVRRRVFEKIYYIGWEEIDIEASKRKKWHDNGTVLALKDGETVV